MINSAISKLATETLYCILERLDPADQLSLALTCSWLNCTFRAFHLGFGSPRWVPFSVTNGCDDCPPSSNYRDGVVMDGKLYIVVFKEEHAVCWTLNLKELHGTWKYVEVKVQKGDTYHPVKSTAAATIRPHIYLYGGETLKGASISVLYRLDPNSMTLCLLDIEGEHPTARTTCSLNAIDKTRLAMFGGCCVNNGKHYVTKECLVYDTIARTWAKYAQRSELIDDNSSESDSSDTGSDSSSGSSDGKIPYARSHHSTAVLDGKLYVYGGVHMTSSAITPCIHDDEDLWSWDGTGGWRKYVAPQRGAASLALPTTWIATSGAHPGRRRGAAMFSNGRRITLLGGLERDGWRDVAHLEKPWEHMHILLPHNVWVRLHIGGGLPEMECVGMVIDDAAKSGEVFVLGLPRGEPDRLVMGWIRDMPNVIVNYG